MMTAPELLVLDDVAIRDGDRIVFPRTRWSWRRDEQWAILGPNGSGKSLLARALCDQAPVVRGELRRQFPDLEKSVSEEVALLSPHVQRELITHESSFYQSRWHSGLDEGQRTAGQFLSQASVENLNPFEIGARRGDRQLFASRRRRFIQWLGIRPLLRRKLIHLSNGEQRKVLLAHTLLRAPRLLILDDPFGGLDVASRDRLKTVVHRLMNAGLPVLLITSRPDEIPPQTTHVLLVDRHRVLAQGSKRVILKQPLARRLAAWVGQSGFKSTGPDQAVVVGKQPAAHRSPSRIRPGQPLVELSHITIRRGRKCILQDVSWTIRRGENWALVGPNGSGKTTLLSLIQGDNPLAYALDLRLFGLRPDSTQTLWQMRQRIGWLSPELHMHYPTAWSCLDVVCSGFFNTIGLYQHCPGRQRAAARRLLGSFGLAARMDQPFGEFSQGDQRLILLARAMVKRPALLILDEPCQGLDAAHRHAMLDCIDRLIAQSGASLIFVTHHAGEMPRCVSHRLRLKAGRIVLLKHCW